MTPAQLERFESRLRSELAGIERADAEERLAEFADGTYGACANCGRRIAVARLDARPTAPLCIDCARLER